MHIIHVALGGCLTFPDVSYGITDDTGGHIAYVLGAALAQARRADVARVDIVTRAFDDPTLGRDYARLSQRVNRKTRILRLATPDSRYLAKEALMADRPAMGRAFSRLISGFERKPDVIHVHFADAAAVVRDAAEEHSIPVVYTPHSLGIDKLGCMGGTPAAALTTRIEEERAALRTSDAIVVSSRDEAERQVEDYGVDVAAQTHRIPPGVILPPSGPGTAVARALVDPLLDDADRPMILAIARPVRKKNLATLIRAYLNDPLLYDRANLVILAGQRGPDIVQTPETRGVIEELERLAAPHAGRIALPARHSPDVVAQLYRLARQRGGVFVNPALHEPFGLTLLEAAQAGLPVVATREGGPVDILATLGHGVTVDPRDVEQVGTAIAGLLGDPARWTGASQAGRRNIGAFDWEVWAGRAQRVYGGLRRPARTFAAPRRVLACDIDGTLTGCRRSAELFRDWAETRDIPFVVATGRCISEARAVLAEWSLPEPDAFITAVGTELHRHGQNGRLILCPDYAAEIGRDWDRAAVARALAEAGAAMQAPIEQRGWKLACFGNEAEAARIRRHLQAAGLKARVVASHERLIDVLPLHGGKAAAIRAFARRYDLSAADCIVAGDSGNDIDMLTACGDGIIVGNALRELDALPPRAGLYRARGNHADGVLEGLGRAGVLVPTTPARVSA